MGVLAPFVMKIKFLLPGEENTRRNLVNIDYVNRKAEKGKIQELTNDFEENASTAEEEELEGSLKIENQFLEQSPNNTYLNYVTKKSTGIWDKYSDYADIKEIEKKISENSGITWRVIISLREDEALRIGHYERSCWVESVRNAMVELARIMEIPEDNLEWWAGFHQEPGHPHCHIMFWEKEPTKTRGKISPETLRDLKKAFVRNIYENSRYRDILSIEKTYLRDAAVDLTREEIVRLRSEITGEEIQVKEELKNKIGKIRERFPPEISREIKEKLLMDICCLAEMMPAKGSLKFGYMPEEVKEKVLEIAEYILHCPGFQQILDEYLCKHRELAEIYTGDEKEIDQAEKNAYMDLKKRIASGILKEAGVLKKFIYENQLDIQKELAEVLSDLQESIDSTADTDREKGVDIKVGAGGQKAEKKILREAREWYRSSWRYLERIKGVESLARITFREEYIMEVAEKLSELAEFVETERPVLAFLDNEQKAKILDAVNILLEKDNDLHYMISQYGQEKDREKLAEIFLFHVLRIKPREIPPLEMKLHEKRAQAALEKIAFASASILKGNEEEAVWTGRQMYLILQELATEKEAEIITTKWSREAGLTEEKINEITSSIGEGERKIPDKLTWNRFRDNLGYREEEMLNPWMAVLQKDEEKEVKENEGKDKEPVPPTLLKARIPAVLNAVSHATVREELKENTEEIKWTVWTLSWVLRELGVNYEERYKIINDWVLRSGIKMSEARILDMLDRGILGMEENKKDISKVERWLGEANWKRLMYNIGLADGEIPSKPWEYKLPGMVGIVEEIWKGAWISLQREQSKAEYQARLLQEELEREEEKRRDRA